jgi:hypothetical protein
LIQKFAQKIGSKIHRTPEGKIIPADEVRQREMKVANLQAKAETPAAKQAVGDLAARTDDFLPTPGQVTGSAGVAEGTARLGSLTHFNKQQEALQNAAEGSRQQALGVTLDPAAPSMREGIGLNIDELATTTQAAMKKRLRPVFNAADDLGVQVDFSGVLARVKAALAKYDAVPGGGATPQARAERAALGKIVEDLEALARPRVGAEAALDYIGQQKAYLRETTATWTPSSFYSTVVTKLNKAADDAFTAAAKGAGKPEVKTALTSAQNQYREMMETVYEDAVKAALKKNPEDVGRLFWQRGNVSELKQLQKLLSLAQREGTKTAGEAKELTRVVTQGFLQEAVPNVGAAAKWSKMLAEKPALRDTWNALTSAPGGKELRGAMEVLEEAAKIAQRGNPELLGSQVASVPVRRAVGLGVGVSLVTGTISPVMFGAGLTIAAVVKMMGTAYAQGNKGILNMIMRSLRASSAGTAAGAKAAQAAWPELQRFAAENGIDLSAGGPSGASEPDPTAQ